MRCGDISMNAPRSSKLFTLPSPWARSSNPMSDGRDDGRNKLAEAHARDGLVSMVGVRSTCPSTSRHWLCSWPSSHRPWPVSRTESAGQGCGHGCQLALRCDPHIAFRLAPALPSRRICYLAAHTIEASSCAGKDRRLRFVVHPLHVNPQLCGVEPSLAVCMAGVVRCLRVRTRQEHRGLLLVDQARGWARNTCPVLVPL